MNALNRYVEKSFLIIDDFADYRTSLKNILIGIGAHHIDGAANADAAIELYREKKHDIILCDYKLGDGKDGQQVLEELHYREVLRNDTIFIMVTAENTMDMVVGAIEFSPDEYLTKPFTKQTLRTRLDKIYIKKEVLKPILKALNRQDLPSAMEHCDTLIANKSKYSLSCYKTKVDCLLKLGEYKKALSLLLKIAKQRELVWVLLGIGKCYLCLNHYEKAIKAFQKSLKINRFALSALDYQAEAFCALGEYNKALTSINNALKLSPKSLHRYKTEAFIATRLNDDTTLLKANRSVMSFAETSLSVKEGEVLSYLNSLVKAINLSTGTIETRLINEFTLELKKQLKTHKKSPQMQVSLNIIKAQYLSLSNDDIALNKMVSDISKQIIGLEGTIRSYLKGQLSYLKNTYSDIFNMSSVFMEYYISLSINNCEQYNELKANELHNKAIEESNTKERIKILKTAFTYSPHNFNMALDYLQAVIKAKGQAIDLSNDELSIFELSVQTAKDIDPADHRNTLFRNYLKQL